MQADIIVDRRTPTGQVETLMLPRDTHRPLLLGGRTFPRYGLNEKVERMRAAARPFGVMMHEADWLELLPT